MALHITDVSFSYGRGEVLQNLSLSIGTGATVVLGPNGAGKSTLLELMASVRIPSSGQITLDNIGSPSGGRRELRRYRQAISWLPQKVSVFPGLNVREHVAYSGWIKGMTRAKAWEASRPALELVDLSTKETEKVGRLSGGQQRRLGIAGALVHDAEVVLLDEPTAGLDPAQRRSFREVLTRISNDRCVVVSSHDTDDAHASYDNAVVLRDGNILFHGSMADFVSVAGDEGDMRDRMESAYLTRVGVED